MHSKPAKYGLKIWALCDIQTSYAWKLEVNVGMPPGEERTKNVGRQTVMRLCESLEGYTVTVYFFFFFSVPLAVELLKIFFLKTIIGTI